MVLSLALFKVNFVFPFRDTDGISCVPSSLVIFFILFFLCPQSSLLSPRSSQCPLSKPTVAMHICNKLAQPHIAIESYLVTMTCPLKPSILGGDISIQRAHAVLNSLTRAYIFLFQIIAPCTFRKWFVPFSTGDYTAKLTS